MPGYLDGYDGDADGGYGPGDDFVPPTPSGVQDVPTLFVEMDFGSGWEDVSTHTLVRRPLGYNRGGTRELDRPSTGTGTVVLDNSTGRWDRELHPEVKPGVRTRFVAEVQTGMDPFTMGHSALGTSDAFGAGIERLPLFTGRTEGGPRQFMRGFDDVWTWRLSDDFKRLTREDVSIPNQSIQFSGEAVDMVLDSLSPPWGDDRRVDLGVHTVFGTTESVSGSKSALEWLLLLADSERGRFFIGPDGAAVFHATAQAADTVPFGVDPGERRYADLEVEDDDREVFNEVTVSSPGHTDQTSGDTASQVEHGKASLSMSTLLFYETEMFEIAFDLAGRYGEPRARITSLDLGTNDDDWRTLLSKDLGDQVIVKRRTVYNTIETQLSTIEGISLDAPNALEWRLHWALSPVVVVKPNLFTEAESSFEGAGSGTAGWTAGADTELTIHAVPPPGFAQAPHLLGSTSLEARALVIGATAEALSPRKPVTAGLVYEATGWMNGNLVYDLTQGIELEWRRDDDSVVSTVSETIPVAEIIHSSQRWYPISVIGTAPAGATYAVVKVQATQAAHPARYSWDVITLRESD